MQSRPGFPWRSKKDASHDIHEIPMTALACVVPPAATLDPALFLRPIAHRGLHRPLKGPVENSAPAFQAAIDKGYGIECDLQAAKGGAPMVFHDATLDRLVAGRGPIGAQSPARLARLSYRRQPTPILSFDECLALVAAKVPLLVEVKRNKEPPPASFLERIADAASAYVGPIALMSFDRTILTRLAPLAPGVPRGWIVGRHQLSARWWAAPRTARKDRAVSRLLATHPAGIAFLAVEVKIVGSARAWISANASALPLFSWTIRTRRERAAAARWADAPIFEGYEP
jgi:glycerophosphoryl diester phosphodiesterase